MSRRKLCARPCARLTAGMIAFALFAQTALASTQAFNNVTTTLADSQPKLERDPNQPVDDEYTRKIKEYTTQPFFNSPLTDYLPASASVPTPKAVLGDVAGAPNMLPYTGEVHRYMRMLEKASPRVKVFSIGTSEEGREMIAVAISSESNLTQLEANRARLARLADPRTINMDDAEADKLVAASVPVYYITGTIHSTETGAPTALMELAYRMAVDESAYIKSIREHVITLITPVVETDGRDRMVDIYKWHRAHPQENYPPLIYWGHYVAHDNFDTWSPGYLMFIAATHNGISRLYETFGNGGADTVERTLTPSEYARTWYRQNPPLPRVLWSQRDNNNYEETGLLVSLSFFAENNQLFLKNFYLKSKRSIEKPKNEGPAAYVFPSDDPRPGGQAELLRLLQAQGCEISRATA